MEGGKYPLVHHDNLKDPCTNSKEASSYVIKFRTQEERKYNHLKARHGA